MRRRVTLIFTVAVAALALSAAPLYGITFGQLDGNTHPNVGAMVVHVPGGQPIPAGVYHWCSGTLVGPAKGEPVFLTAAHCPAALDDIGIPRSWVKVTFDSSIDPTGTTGTLYSGEIKDNPGWNWGKGKGGLSDPHDVAVILLDAPPAGVTPAQLPELGLLDMLQKQGALRQRRFTAVGYGAVRETMTKAFQTIDQGNLDRRNSESGLMSLTGAWLNLAMVNTPGNQNGGTCYGDSGGPHFIHDADGRETDTVVSVTSRGDRPCKSLDMTYRVDTASAHAFLADFVELP